MAGRGRPHVRALRRNREDSSSGRRIFEQETVGLCKYPSGQLPAPPTLSSVSNLPPQRHQTSRYRAGDVAVGEPFLPRTETAELRLLRSSDYWGLVAVGLDSKHPGYGIGLPGQGHRILEVCAVDGPRGCPCQCRPRLPHRIDGWCLDGGCLRHRRDARTERPHLVPPTSWTKN